MGATRDKSCRYARSPCNHEKGSGTAEASFQKRFCRDFRFPANRETERF